MSQYDLGYSRVEELLQIKGANLVRIIGTEAVIKFQRLVINPFMNNLK